MGHCVKDTVQLRVFIQDCKESLNECKNWKGLVKFVGKTQEKRWTGCNRNLSFHFIYFTFRVGYIIEGTGYNNNKMATGAAILGEKVLGISTDTASSMLQVTIAGLHLKRTVACGVHQKVLCTKV